MPEIAVAIWEVIKGGVLGLLLFVGRCWRSAVRGLAPRCGGSVTRVRFEAELVALRVPHVRLCAAEVTLRVEMPVYVVFGAKQLLVVAVPPSKSGERQTLPLSVWIERLAEMKGGVKQHLKLSEAHLRLVIVGGGEWLQTGTPADVVIITVGELLRMIREIQQESVDPKVELAWRTLSGTVAGLGAIQSAANPDRRWAAGRKWHF
jgi:hypothetical protein